jgi:hypothetical protein
VSRLHRASSLADLKPRSQMAPAQALLASGLVVVAHPAPSAHRPSGPNVTKVHVPGASLEQFHATAGVLGGLRELDGLPGALEQRHSPSLAVRPSYSRGDCASTRNGGRSAGTVDAATVPAAFLGSGARQDCLILPASRNGRGTRMDRNGSSDVHKNVDLARTAAVVRVIRCVVLFQRK